MKHILSHQGIEGRWPVLLDAAVIALVWIRRPRRPACVFAKKDAVGLSIPSLIDSVPSLVHSIVDPSVPSSPRGIVNTIPAAQWEWVPASRVKLHSGEEHELHRRACSTYWVIGVAHLFHPQFLEARHSHQDPPAHTPAPGMNVVAAVDAYYWFSESILWRNSFEEHSLSSHLG
jgi:hypothetical protein